MTIGNVSFGRVVAVTGSYKKAGKLQNRMKQQLKQEKVIAYDVTDKYRYASTGGVLANSANKGECSLVYVTGKDVKKVKNKEAGWDTLDGILSHMSQHIDLNKESTNRAVDLLA
ncbi:MAG: hypothetical protein IJY61_03795 [Candidatus Gastranaerophilales bacterium]|nr:hypothetical protein [Candidatus Gastranaerophilales bacterium]